MLKTTKKSSKKSQFILPPKKLSEIDGTVPTIFDSGCANCFYPAYSGPCQVQTCSPSISYQIGGAAIDPEKVTKEKLGSFGGDDISSDEIVVKSSGFKEISSAEGVLNVISGNAFFEYGQAEAVKIEFDPSKISIREILNIYFSVCNDPAIFYSEGQEEKIRSALDESNVFPMFKLSHFAS